jgi:hypothetical protein
MEASPTTQSLTEFAQCGCHTDYIVNYFVSVAFVLVQALLQGTASPLPGGNGANHIIKIGLQLDRPVGGKSPCAGARLDAALCQTINTGRAGLYLICQRDPVVHHRATRAPLISLSRFCSQISRAKLFTGAELTPNITPGS